LASFSWSLSSASTVPAGSFCERLVRRGEHGEGTLAFEGIGQARGLDSRHQGGEVARRFGGIDNVGFLAGNHGGAGGDERRTHEQRTEERHESHLIGLLFR
jgi:hypothetical protein